MGAEKVELLPCPWCGEKLTHGTVSEGSTFRWRKVDGCCADGPEVRHDTMADDQDAAEADSRARAFDAWNTRAAPAQPATAVGEAVAIPSAVRDWHAAEKSRIEAVAAYNAHHAYVKEHCPFGTSVNEQYQAMEAARRDAFSKLPALFAAVTQMLAHPTPPTLHTAPDAGEGVAYAVFARSDECQTPVMLGDYVGRINKVQERVMERARREGFKGTFAERLAELGWWLEPLVQASAYDALAAENARLREMLDSPANHHRVAQWLARAEAAEAARDAAVGVLRDAREIVAAHAIKYMRGPTLLARMDALIITLHKEKNQ